MTSFHCCGQLSDKLHHEDNNPELARNPSIDLILELAMPDPLPNAASVTIIHPDLGIGGAERLIIDVALALQNNGHKVTIYTSHRDKSHCFEEARDGTLDVRVRGDTIFPVHIGGRLHVLFAVLRQVHLTWSLLGELAQTKGGDAEEVFIVDQVPACVPLLKVFGPRQHQGKGKQRILFYCHFPDQLLARRDEGSSLLTAVKTLYRYPFDWFEGWAMSASDRVVANSKFTRGVVKDTFGGEKLGDVTVVYPCVDTTQKASEAEGKLWGGKRILLSVNRFERKKDLALAIRAYHGLGEAKRRGTRLVIAGMYILDSSVLCCAVLTGQAVMTTAFRKTSNTTENSIPSQQV
jgi:alpha-1,3/alpha-1,6-mannosyltransferase